MSMFLMIFAVVLGPLLKKGVAVVFYVLGALVVFPFAFVKMAFSKPRRKAVA